MADRFPLIVDADNTNIKELPSGDNLDLTGSDIVNVVDVTTSGNMVVGGNLTVNGTTTTINSATLEIDDKNIVLASGAANAAAADGAGISIDGASANLTYSSSSDEFSFNKGVTVPSLTTTGNISFGDNDKAIFGAGSDLQIYHSGSDSFVRDLGDGNLNLWGTNVTIGSSSGNLNLTTVAGGATTLLHGNAAKVATTSTGIDVTGTANVSSEILVGNSDSRLAENGLRFLSSGAAYIDHNTVGQVINFRLSGSSSLDTTPLVVSSTGIQVTGDISNASGDLTLDVAGDIELDAGGGDFIFKDDGTSIFLINHSSSDVRLTSMVNNKDIIFRGNDGGSFITALTLDMSAAGAATFNSSVKAAGLEVEASTPVIEIDSTTAANLATLQFTTAGTVDSKITHQASSGDMAIESGRNSTWGGKIYLKTDTFTNALFTRTTSTFNEASADMDFRVESDSNTNMLFVDGGNNRVGVGTGNPLNPLHLVDSSATSQLLIQGDSNDASIKFNKTGQTFIVGIDATDNSFKISDNLTLGSNDRLTIASDGAATFSSTVSVAGVGVIGATDGDLNIFSTASSHGGLRFGNTHISPTNNSGIITNDVMSLGLSGARFTNLYLTDSVQNSGKAGSATIFNEDGTTADFRVESNNNTHMLVVDGGADRVIVGTSGGLTSTFNVSGNAQFSNGTGNVGSLSIAPSNDRQIITANSPGSYGDYGVTLKSMRATGGSAYINNIDMTYQATVLNEEGYDLDFRVESNDSSHMLFVEGGTNRVGINNNDPSSTLHVTGTYGDTGFIRMSGGAQEHYWYLEDAVNSVFNIGTGSLGAAFDFRTNNVSKFKIGAGEVVANESSADQDFRVESNNHANMFRVDAGTDKVAVKLSTSEPVNTLDVNGDISFTRTISKKVTSGSANSNYFTIYEKDFESSAFTTNQHWVRITGAGSTNGTHASAEFYITFKQQGGSKYFNIVPIEKTGLTIGYTYDASGGASSAGKLKIFAASVVGFYTYIQVFATARDGNSDDAITRGTFPMTDTGSGTAPSGMITMAFPLNYGANKYQISGYASNQYVINEDSNDMDFRVESNNNTHALFVDGSSGYIGINDNSPSAQLNLNTSDGLMTILNSTHTNGGYVRFEKSGTIYGDLGNGAQIVSSGSPTAFGMNTRGTGDLLLATNGVTRASLQNGGAFTTFAATGAHAVFNENGVNADFRVESNGNTHAIFVDASSDRVAILDSTPVSAVDIVTGNGSPADSGSFLSIKSGTGNLVEKLNLGVNSTSGYAFIAAVRPGISTRELRIQPNGGGTTFNDDGNDQDFRVESNDNTHMLFVDAGNNRVAVGRSNPQAKLDINAGAEKGIEIALGTSAVPFINFLYGATTVGSITTTGSATVYNTSSDQRLKENIADADDAGSKIDAIQVRKFDWKADGSHQDYGMIAQELQAVAPEAVSAPEDPDETMGVDYSKLVPMLVKEIQTLRARVAQLESN